MFGLPADLDGFFSFGIPIIEDCAHAVGARYKGRAVGGIGMLSICSFYATKMIGAAGGGFIAAQGAGLIDRARELSWYNGKKGAELRFNYRLSNLQAALARCQLARLDSYVHRRKAIARQYNAALRHLDLQLPGVADELMDHVFYRYMVQVKGAGDEFRRRMLKEGVRCGYGVLEPLHSSLGLPARDFPNSHQAAEHAVSLPIYPALGEDDIRHVATVVQNLVSGDELSALRS
jgi:dTDP-4-amino-4,6-dideoxygalactose transaminase